MMHLFLNCLAASAGSGLTYVRNVVPQLAARPELRATLALTPQLRNGLGHSHNISFLEVETASGSGRTILLGTVSTASHDPGERCGCIDFGR